MQSTDTFHGFSKPTSNFFRLPNEWTDITAGMTSLAELKVVEYVLKHTWGYSEFDAVKKITTDEFMSGRKDRHGERLDRGTGLSNKSVIDGLARAVADGYLLVEVDDSDRARIRKYYKLAMRPTPDDKPEDKLGAEGDGVKNGKSDVKNLHISTEKVHSSYEESPYRSEKEKREIYNNVKNVDENKTRETNGKSREEVAYFAGALADKLGDQKSITYYKVVCARYDPHELLRKAAEITADGVAKNPGAVFTAWVKTLAA